MAGYENTNGLPLVFAGDPGAAPGGSIPGGSPTTGGSPTGGTPTGGSPTGGGTPLAGTNTSYNGTFQAGKNNPLNIFQASSPFAGLVGLLQSGATATGPSFAKGAGGRALGQVFNTAMGESFQSQDRAANRLRERLTGAARGQEQQLRDAAAESGGASTGFFNQNLVDLAGQQQGAYAQGLVQLEDSFADNRNQLLQTGLGAAGQIQQGDQFLQELAQQGFEFDKGTAADLLSTAGSQAIDSQNGFNSTLADIFLGNQKVIADKQIADAQNEYANFSNMWDAVVRLITSGQAGSIV